MNLRKFFADLVSEHPAGQREPVLAPTAEAPATRTGGVSAVTDLALELHGKEHLTRGPYERMSAFMERMRQKKFGRKPRKQLPHQQAFDLREYRMFASPGRVVQGPPRPTAPKAGAELNTVDFAREKALLFSDGSFRIPGRRRLKALDSNGRTIVLSGRQLRILRKTTRRALKAQQEATATV